MNTQEFQERLKEIEACAEGLEWAKNLTPRQAWETCDRGDWLLFWARAEKCSHRKTVLARTRFNKLFLHLITDKRCVNAIDVSERYGLGEATLEEFYAALDEATKAVDKIYAEMMADDDYTATEVVYFAAYRAYMQFDPRGQSDAWVVGNAARTMIRKKFADIVRETITPTWIKD